MIYVPDLANYDCFVVQSEGVIRAYEQVPIYDSEVAYRDYYINSNYIYRDGVQSFGRYSTLPICIDNNALSSEYYYRNDFDSILVIFLILSIFIVYIPIKICSRFFRRFQ